MKAALNRSLPCRSVQSCGAQHGVGLVEVLIALVVFALGVIAMAGLQLRTMSLTMDSTQRTYVINNTQDIADKIRGNGIPPMKYVDTYNDEPGEFCSETPVACAGTLDGTAAGCSMEEMAAANLYDTFCVGDGSYERQVVDWKTVISCNYPLAGVMTPTTDECNELGALVSIETTWFARSVDDTEDENPERDSMTLSFVP